MAAKTKTARKTKSGRRGIPGPAPIVDPALDGATADVLAGTPIPEAIAKWELSDGRGRTLRRRVDAARAGKAAPGATPAPASPSAAPVRPPAGAQVAAPELPQGGGVSRPDALLVLVRRILGKRDPGALAELDAGLLAEARGELGPWLERPIERGEAVDPIDALARALDAATLHVERLQPLHPRAATMLGAVATLATKLEAVTKGRPREATRDEVTERIEARRDECVRKIMQYTGEARAKLERDRAELVAWGRGAFGEHGGAELERRVGAMLGAA